MQLLRRVVRFCLGAEVIAFVGITLLIVVSMGRLRNALADGDLPPSTYTTVMLITLIFPVLGMLPAMAWWTLKKGTPSARRWIIAASVLNILALVSGIDMWRRAGVTFALFLYGAFGVIGILSLIAFWRKDTNTAVPKRARIAGDGTSKFKDYGAQAIAVAIIWFSADCWGRWARIHHLSYPALVTALIEIEIAVLLTTFGHELGHLVAGWLSGKLLRSFQVGPFRWAIRNGVWKFEFNLRKFYGGAVGMVTPDLVNMRSRLAFFIMGGPIASLVMGSICIVATLLTPGHVWQRYWLLLSAMASLSISAFVVNLIPLKPESNYSDGAQLYQIVTNGPWARVHFAFAMVTTSLVTAVRPRDFDVNVLNLAAKSVPVGERGLLLRLFACLHYVDANQIPQALASLQDAEALYGQSIFEKPQDICAEFVFVNAFYKLDLAAAEQWWQKIEALRKNERDAGYWRAKTALLWLRGEREKARATWEIGNALAAKLPAAGNYEFTRFCFLRLRKALDAPIQTTPPPLEGLAALAVVCNMPESQVAV